ncbi:MAG: hypothetical protein HY646_17810 [Acidobacteria bacterium]|nr:hypothetical protein [Acidobacteriota bacterium]
MSNFFPIRGGDAWYLAVLLAVVVISFLPQTRAVQVAGMSLFGWMMSGLMVIAPLVALVRLILERDDR